MVIFTLIIFVAYFCTMGDSLLIRSVIQQKLSRPNYASVSHNVDDADYRGISVSGLVSKGNNFAVPSIFTMLHDKGNLRTIKVLTDDIAFARKRLTSPKSVYSGLADQLQYIQHSESGTDLQNALVGTDAWLNFNMTIDQLVAHSNIAASLAIKRVVFAVNASDHTCQMGGNLTFDESCDILRAADVQYTIVKYGQLNHEEREAVLPYRIVHGCTSVPVGPSLAELLRSDKGKGDEHHMTSIGTENEEADDEDDDAFFRHVNTDKSNKPPRYVTANDLYRVLSEIIFLPKSFGKVLSIGPGNMVDSQILTFMKAQGWNEGEQVNILLGDLVEEMQQKYLESIEKYKKGLADDRCNKTMKATANKTQQKEEVEVGSVATRGFNPTRTNYGGFTL